MDYITLTPDNLEKEHICCALSGTEAQAKKNWLRERLAAGLVFRKSVERGKCFIEYLPAEEAWAPIKADGYLYIDCLWVSGSFKGHGYSNDLLDYAVADAKAKGKHGLCILSSVKKQGFLADPKYLAYKGFTVCDTAEPYFTLTVLRLDDAPLPQFTEAAKHPHVEGDGYTVLYTDACPFTSKYVPLLKAVADGMGAKFTAVHLTTKAEAQAAPVAFTTFSLFYNGNLLTHEIQSEKKFAAIIEANR